MAKKTIPNVQSVAVARQLKKAAREVVKGIYVKI
jgi:hypothetical protein